MQIPFFRPIIDKEEIEEVFDTLKSGWLTTGPKTKKFEEEFAKAVNAPFAVAVNSCTAALHLALEALHLQSNEAVLVPTMTFAATAEVVRYLNAEPVLVDVHSDTLHINLNDAEERLRKCSKKVVGIIPVHIGGMMVNMEEVNKFAKKHNLWVVEDAAHSFPAGWRKSEKDEWRMCGSGDSEVTCFSFYANKTITTGEGGMATTHKEKLAERMRIMSLHGISKDAWKRFSSSGNWYYEIVAPGFKYNLTDVAASIGIHQLKKAELFRKKREEVAKKYFEGMKKIEEIELPPDDINRIHSWHLYFIKLNLEKLSISRSEFIDKLKERGVLTSVHWMPLHMHPYYKEVYGYKESDFETASKVYHRLISLPIFPDLREEEIEYVIENVREICEEYRN